MANTAGRLRRVGFGNEIIDLDIIAECLEAMGKSSSECIVDFCSCSKAQNSATGSMSANLGLMSMMTSQIAPFMQRTSFTSLWGSR